MDVLFLVGTLIAPVVLAFALQRGKLWWLASALTAAVGAYLLISVDATPHHGDDSVVGAWTDFGNLLQQGYGMFMIAYAMVLLALVRTRKRRPR